MASSDFFNNPNLTGPVNTFLVFRYLVLGIGFFVIMNFVGKKMDVSCPKHEQWIKSEQFQFKVRDIKWVQGCRCYEISTYTIKNKVYASYDISSSFASYLSIGDSLIKNKNTLDFVLVKRDSTFILTESCKGLILKSTILNSGPFLVPSRSASSLNLDQDWEIVNWKKDKYGQIGRRAKDGYSIMNRYNLIGKDSLLVLSKFGKPNVILKSKYAYDYFYYVAEDNSVKGFPQDYAERACFMITFDTLGKCILSNGRYY